MKRETTSEAILRAARALFRKEGEAGVSMRRVAEAAEITPMAIYKHFAGKDALLNVLMRDGFTAWEARVTGILAQGPIDWLEKLAEAFLDFALTEPRAYEAAFLLKATEARRYPQDFAAGQSPVMRMAHARIEEARAKGVIGPASAVEIGLSFSALCQGLVSMYRAGRFASEREFRRAYRQALRHCLRSFVAETES